ncbi:DUF4280 domain-containing protein [Chryseobacterium sp. SNU WT5]|uniref:PAAR-like protein n=1 Tax=Chryseobacterium sp. SNU WT5 TaxID=2594269 RepID=UPI001181374D|nr:PAAR-like protein [Chryseobacterium sp. SNU WT5]QDP84758.1 DUF4280 domain-containing protein [Chryseobacterium sp. SNU WT5]
MAESYIPETTDVICTLMQKGPNKIGLGDRTSYVTHPGKTAPLLNGNDKKISESFQCKNASKFWGGLQTLCLGIAIGALVVLAVVGTVLTGGALAVLLVAVAGTLLVSASAGVIGIYKTIHDCDVTKDAEWSFLHNTVNIDGAKALLNRSVLNCSKGGKVTIIVDPVIAQSAADQIISNNENEVAAHMTSQFVMGLITGATSATPAALAVASPLAIYSYNNAESTEQAQRLANQDRDSFGRRAADAGKDHLRDTGLGLPGGFVEGVAESTIINQAAQREAIQFGQQAAAREAAGDVAGAANARIAQGAASRVYNTPWKGMLKGLGIGLAAGVVNFGIDQWSNSYEDRMHGNSVFTADQSDIKDGSNSISIIATEA